ncbi:putative drug transport transmembrane protein [Photobacterium sp. SKA34]|uniref:hypothetical protein n=1 Tax=Photobacterium sp. SKA34 TaxID=121723 RepID=UPI00006AEAEE|nr:hypothetical protein [Photobacterium sp. SKA34]EAR57421.1 putative drug transport transmembrane protein [Photobacterium sp. SKA34]
MLVCCIINLKGTPLIQFNTALIFLGIGWNFMFIAATRFLTTTYQPKDKAKAQGYNESVVFSSVAGWLNNTISWYQLNLVVIPFVFVIIAVLFMFKPKLMVSFKPQSDSTFMIIYRNFKDFSLNLIRIES